MNKTFITKIEEILEDKNLDNKDRTVCLRELFQEEMKEMIGEDEQPEQGGDDSISYKRRETRNELRHELLSKLSPKE